MMAPVMNKSLKNGLCELFVDFVIEGVWPLSGFCPLNPKQVKSGSVKLRFYCSAKLMMQKYKVPVVKKVN